MARQGTRLTDKEIKAAPVKDKKWKLYDTDGMFLEIRPNGGKYWKLKYRIDGKPKEASLGVYPQVSLQQARISRDEHRDLVRSGIDPNVKKKADKDASTTAATNSFAAIASEWFAVKQSSHSDGHKKRVKRAIDKDLIPSIGHLAVSEISAPVLLEALRLIEKRDSIETAHRTKQISGQIFRYAIATGRAENDPSASLTGALKKPKKGHFAAITDPREVGRLLVAIDECSSTLTVKSALKLSALFFCRPGELRHLKWSDINNDENRIEITAQKTKQQHIIPICRQAKDILNDLFRLTGNGEFIFPSARGRSRPMSENALRVALRSMGYDNETMTPHGFRAMARTLLDEVLEYRIEWIEQQLAHSVRDANGRAYNRTTHLAQRTEMMQRWADYLDELKAKTLNDLEHG